MTAPREPLELPVAIIREAVPDDDIVLAYVTRGAMARYVEGVASVNAEFRAELEACIDGLEDAGEAIGAAARTWRAAPEERSARIVPIGRPRAAKKNPIQRWMLIAVAAGILLMVGAAGLRRQREEAQIQAENDSKFKAQQVELDRLMGELAEQQRIADNAQNEAERAAADAQRSATMRQIRTAQSAQTGMAAAAGRKATSSAKAACNCQPGDPLCACF